MITASGSEQRLAALEVGCRRLRHQTLRQERAAGAGGVAGADQALPRHHPAAGRRVGRSGTPNSKRGSPNRFRNWSGTNRLRRFLSPQLADLVVGDESLLASHRREIVVLFTDLRNFTPFAESERARGGDGRPGASTTTRIGGLVHAYEGTLERFTGDGIMVFFNDPIQCDDAAERAVRMALEIRDAVARSRRRLAPQRS